MRPLWLNVSFFNSLEFSKKEIWFTKVIFFFFCHQHFVLIETSLGMIIISSKTKWKQCLCKIVWGKIDCNVKVTNNILFFKQAFAWWLINTTLTFLHQINAGNAEMLQDSSSFMALCKNEIKLQLKMLSGRSLSGCSFWSINILEITWIFCS